MRQVAGKSAEYLAAHMGDMLHAALVREGESTFGSYSIASWATRLNENLFVLRLIEEGQTGPGEVVAAVSGQLDIELGRLEEFYSKYDNSDLAKLRANMAGGKYDNEDVYHAQHGRYQGPVRELGRIVAVIYGCCVVLANLERMDNQQSLTRWLKVDNARGWGSAEFDVWLVDRCMRGPQFRDTALAKEWVADCDGAVISSDDKTKLSAWDAPWSKSEPLLGAMGVNTEGARTVEVLKLPAKIPLDGVKMAVILGKFVKSASLAAKALEEGR